MEKTSENKILNLYTFLFYLIIFEGAIRKWLLPNFNIEIIIFRDFLVIYIIHLGIKNKLFKTENNIERFCLLWTSLVFIWSLLQFVFNDISYQIILIGLRNWILYIWVAILFYRIVKNIDTIEIFLFRILITLIPISLIVIFQYNLPVDHFLNTYLGLEDSFDKKYFVVSDNIVRATGTFAFSYSFVQFLMFLTPVIYLLLIDKFYSNKLKYIFIFGYTLCVLLSGARGIYIFISVYLFINFFILFKKKTAKIILSIFFIFIIFLFLNIFFLEILIPIYDRFETAAVNENLMDRIIYTLVGNTVNWQNFNILGYGIGYGSNPAKIYTLKPFILGEFETDRILFEGGVVGILFILIKIFLSFFLVKRSVYIFNQFNYFLPILFNIYYSINILTSNILSQITAHGLSFLGLGIALALVNKKLYVK